VEFIKNLGMVIQKGAWWGPGGIQRQRACVSLLQALLKPTLTMGREE
jgi:hypothetical protein